MVTKHEFYCRDCEEIWNEVQHSELTHVQSIITSPPYYQQRSYVHKYELGLETTPKSYIDNLVSKFNSLLFLLAADGLLFVNIGDKYKDGSPIGIPWMFVNEMRQRLTFIQEIIWHKTRCKPEKVTKRFTIAHEPIFMFSKRGVYYFDSESIREENSPTSKTGGKVREYKYGKQFSNQSHTPRNGRNKRSVWSVAANKGTGNHVAPFPKELVRTMVLCSTKPGDWVLDPFCGSGTVACVCKELGRNSINFDINPNAITEAKLRLSATHESNQKG